MDRFKYRYRTGGMMVLFDIQFATLNLFSTRELVFKKFNYENLMQYTWVKDKNWEEIYEWDYVKLYSGIYEVAHSKLWLTLIYPDWSWDESEDWLRWSDLGKLEVLWNIYETPDLINNDD